MMIDLTHSIHEGMTLYPGTPDVILEKVFTIEEFGFMEHRMAMTTHTGTHVDAPGHLLKTGKTLDQFPIDQFAGKAGVIPCHHLKEIDKEHLEKFEMLISKTEFILFYTGWQKKWGTPAYFESFPVLTPEAARWLAQHPLKGVGFDTISPDLTDSEEYPNHHILMEQEILIYENLTQLEKLPDDVFMFYGMPVKLDNTEGAPVRAFAEIITVPKSLSVPPNTSVCNVSNAILVSGNLI
ncbi:MAG: cyclase family protein [Bacteroidales bacterium]|nr:cyclase family protein [Bacteroidales bacterium]